MKYINKKIVRYILIYLSVFIVGFAGAFTYSAIFSKNSTTTTNSLNLTKTSVSNTSDGSQSDIIAACADSVVEIRTESVQMGSYFQDAVTEGAGSGIIISNDGYIMTNYHVIDGANSIKVTTKDGDEYPATLVGGDDENDVAVLKIDAKDLTSAAIGDSDSIKVGETVYAIGNPLGKLGGTVTEGIISATSREITIDNNTMTLLQTSAAINSGNSGGGLFNANGELIGMVNAKSSGSDVEGLGFAIPSNTATDIATQLVDKGYVSGKYKIGVSVISIDSEMMANRYGVDSTGIYVSEVLSGSDAEKAGFEAGDRIVSLNGKKYDDTSELISAIKSSENGDSLKFKIDRDGKDKTITINVE